MVIKILGTGCPNCQKLEANAKQALSDLKMNATFEKVTEIQDILGYGVMGTPALVVDEKVISYGSIISTEEIKELLNK